VTTDPNDPRHRLPGGEHGDAPVASTPSGAPSPVASTSPTAAPGKAHAPAGDGNAPPPVHHERRARHMGWRSSDVLRTAALVIAFYLALRLLWFAQHLVIVTFLGVLFGLAVTAGVDRLERWRIPRGVSAAVIVFGFVGLLGLFGAWMAPTLREQSKELRTKLPEAIDKIEAWAEKRQSGLLGMFLGEGRLTPAGSGSASTQAAAAQPGAGASSAAATPATPAAPAAPVRDSASEAGGPRGTRDAISGLASTVASGATGSLPGADAPPQEGASRDAQGGGLRGRVVEGMGSARRYLFSFITSTFAVLGGVLFVLVMAIYVAADPRLYHDGLMHLFPRPARRRAGDVLTAVATVLRKWLLSQLIAMVVIGVVTTGVLMALGVRAAVPLGILAGLLEFIPMIGPIMSAVPAVAMGFVDSPEKALWVAVAYTGIQFAENHLLIPILMKEGVDIPPALTIIAIALMGLVFGFLGMLVAVPMLAAVMVVVKMLYVEDVVGDQVTVIEDDDD
jgi:predicted PurR-regulated permease PerM